jgi:hypothetical protein
VEPLVGCIFAIKAEELNKVVEGLGEGGVEMVLVILVMIVILMEEAVMLE